MRSRRYPLWLICILLGGCSDGVPKRDVERCERPQEWLDGKHSIPELGQYIPIAVRTDSFVINRTSVVGIDGFKSYLRDLDKVASLPEAVKPHIFLISNDQVGCGTFLRAARTTMSIYQCQKSELCIWGYGLGEQAFPANVPAPTLPTSR